MTTSAENSQAGPLCNSGQGQANILIVDDLRDRLVAMEAILEELGQNIVRATSGREALRLVLQNDFAVILLDVNMPDLDGFETAALIRSRRRSTHTPIIFVTAFGDEAHAFQGYSLGAVDYILTPVNPNVLRAKVRVFVELFQKNEQLKQQNKEQASLRALADRRAAQLRHLAAELAYTEQRERARLAGVLHDHIQQLLVAARMASDHVRNQLPDETHQQQLSAVIKFIDQSISASRSLATELSPPVLREAGLAAALEWLGRWVQQNYGLPVQVQCEPGLHPLADEMRMTLFQAVRELLFNVVKHSGADQATIALQRHGDRWLQVVVEDHGSGFDPTSPKGELRQSGLGLFSISERVETIGGRFEIDSAPGRGTCIRLYAPLEPADTTLASHAVTDQASAVPAPPVGQDQPSAEPPAGGQIRVLLVDDHAVVRTGLRSLLQGDLEIEVVAEAADGQEAIQCVQNYRPDVVIMDVSMPRMNGVEATKRIRAEHPETAVVGMSFHEEEEIVASMIRAGATAYITKGGAPEALAKAIRDACARSRLIGEPGT